jgi:hypothetical protein
MDTIEILWPAIWPAQFFQHLNLLHIVRKFRSVRILSFPGRYWVVWIIALMRIAVSLGIFSLQFNFHIVVISVKQALVHHLMFYSLPFSMFFFALS